MYRNVAHARVGPIASTTRVVVNVRADENHFNHKAIAAGEGMPGNVERWNTMEGELLVTNKQSRSSYRDPNIRVYPFCDDEMKSYALAQVLNDNTWTYRVDTESNLQFNRNDAKHSTDPQKLKPDYLWHPELEALRDVKFVGTARTSWDFKRDDIHPNQGYAAHSYGMVTTINTSTDEICPGDIIRLGLPDLVEDNPPIRWQQTQAVMPTIRGIPRKKQLFATKIYDVAKITQDIKCSNTNHNILGDIRYFNYIEQARSLIIGMAASRASSGERLDIVLHSPSSVCC